MSVSLIVGTPKGAAILKSKDRRSWSEEFVLRGWPVTASVRDDKGRIYVAVNSPNYGVAMFASDDLENWKQLEAAPRYRPEDRGNPEHHRIVAQGGLRRHAQGRRTLRRPDLDAALRPRRAVCGRVGSRPLRQPRPRPDRWQPIDGFNEQPGARQLGAGLRRSRRAHDPDRREESEPHVGRRLGGGFLPHRRRRQDLDAEEQGRQSGVDSARHTGQCVHSVTHDPTNAKSCSARSIAACIAATTAATPGR